MTCCLSFSASLAETQKKLHLFTSMLSAHPLGIDERSFKGFQLENHEGNIKTATTTSLHTRIIRRSFSMWIERKKCIQQLDRNKLLFQACIRYEVWV